MFRKKKKSKAPASAYRHTPPSPFPPTPPSPTPASPPGSPPGSPPRSPSPPAAATPPPGPLAPPIHPSHQEIGYPHPQPPRYHPRRGYIHELEEMSRIPGLKDFEVSSTKTYRWNFGGNSMEENYSYHHGPSYGHMGPPPGYYHGHSPPRSPPPQPNHSLPRSPPPPSYGHMPGPQHGLPPPPPPPPGQHFETIFSDENPNGCRIN